MGGELCAHGRGGGGQRERTTHEYYGIMGVGGVGWWCVWDRDGIERAGGGVDDGVARECMCTRIHACVRGIQAIVTDNGQT